MSTTEQRDERWKLDRKISPSWVFGVLCAGIVGIITQTYYLVNWANATSATIASVQTEVSRLKVDNAESDRRLIERSDERYRGIVLQLEGLNNARIGDGVRIARLEEQFGAVRQSLERIERSLEARLKR